jgi:drug/metabolite transporter (DMT)-like permease
LSKSDWIRLLLIGLIGGAVPFLLFFKGLSLASATSAAFIHKTLFIWVAFLALPLLKEKLSVFQFLALGMMAVGVYLFAGPAGLALGLGEMLVFFATILWAVENIIAKIALKNIAPVIVGWGRMFFGSLFLLAYLVFSGGVSLLAVSSLSQASWLFLSGAFLFGYVVTWYTALKHAPATVVSSVLVVAAPITALLNGVFVSGTLNGFNLVPALMIVAGVLGLVVLKSSTTKFLKNKVYSWMAS